MVVYYEGILTPTRTNSATGFCCGVGAIFVV